MKKKKEQENDHVMMESKIAQSGAPPGRDIGTPNELAMWHNTYVNS
jgi:hypothetical protein